MLEVGMYVKFKDYISKITHINKTKNGYQFVQFKEPNGMNVNVSIDLIKKASHSLLGNNEEPCLIEVGDYVNGEKVIKIYEKGECYDGSHYVFITKTIETENDNYETIPHDHLYTDYSINSIVTKEQFESISYKVGE